MSGASAPGMRRGGLLRKYLVPLVVLVAGALLTSGGLDMWFSYQESRATLAQIQSEKAVAAAARIEQFVDEITRQIGWTTRAQWSSSVLEQRRLEYLQLLRQAPAITEVSHLDGQGFEELKVSRVAMDAIGSRTDFSAAPQFVEARARKIWFSPVYFLKESEPYMTVAIAGQGRDRGVTVAEVNLKFIWDVVSRITVGKAGYAYVVDGRGFLIAHPDIGLVLRKTELGSLPQVAAALQADRQASQGDLVGRDPADREVLTANAVVEPVGWRVFVDLPLSEAFAPLYASLQRTAGLMLLGLVLAVVAGFFLARRIVEPVRLLQAGATRLGAGDLSHRIEVRTNDELATLADTFNAMAGQLRESYASLELKVEERTEALARSIEELKVLGEAGQAVVSTLNLATVLDSLVPRAVEVGHADAGLAFRYERSTAEFALWRATGLAPEVAAAVRELHILRAETTMGQAVTQRRTMQIADLTAAPKFPLRDLVLQAGYRAVLIVPLVRADRIFGAMTLLYRNANSIPERASDLMQTFASQSILAIQNARLFREIEEKSRQLELASQHKSQFLANMSHELRTPLNAILGYAELLADGIYGDLSQKQRDVLDRIQSNGRHLLGLINDVLDLSKIEAGQFTLAIQDYALPDVVRQVVSATESLASAKGLALTADCVNGMQMGRGDERRIAQVLLNLVGNAIKFTDAGKVEIRAAQAGSEFSVEVIDTGPGISLEDQKRIFDEFQQVDNTSTRRKGGTGLGLAISRRIVEMHGGRISVESEPGRGSTFRVLLPVRVEQQVAA